MSWRDLESADADLAATGVYRLNGRVSYLATARADGNPRVHPVTPIIGEGRLFLFMEPTSPKGRDLARGSRFALHCGVEDKEGGGGEFTVSGRGVRLEDAGSRAQAARLASYEIADRYILFELLPDEAMATTYGDSGAERTRWRAGAETPSQHAGPKIAP